MRVRTILGCLLMLGTATLAQQARPIAPGAAPRTTPKALPTSRPAASLTPALLGDDGKPVAGVSLVSAEVKAVIRGPLAEASVTLHFRNETDRVLGGELTFPLPEGATVAGYALDVDGTLVDGVAVEKQRARVTYETEMNKRVDPGLVEHVIGNNFRTRLYPVPAKGTRTLRVTYIADLTPSPDGKGASFTMPMGLGEKLAALDLTVAVEGATQPPVVKGGSYTNKEFQGTPRGFYLQDSLGEARALDSLTVLLPEVPASSVIVQKRGPEPATVEELEAAKNKPAAAAAQPAPEHYFVITDSPKRPAEKQANVALANQRVLVIWDASLSRATADTARELKLLEQILTRLGHPSVDVGLLRNDLEVLPPLPAGPQGTSPVIDQLRHVKYDGGTSFGALLIPKNRRDFAIAKAPEAKDYDLALIFTDGVSTVGGDKPQNIEIPVYAISSDPAADHATLRSLCQSSGGTYLNLNRQTDAAAIEAIGRPPFSIVAVECDPAKVAEVTPGVGTVVNDRVTIAGQLLAPEATVTLVYGFGKQEVDRRPFTIKAADAGDGPQVPRFWAQQKANELAQSGAAKRDELVALGKRFNLVTPETSLLVLETADQYVQHGVVPPKSRPAVYKEFSEKIEQRQVEQVKTKEQKLEQVAAMWEAKKQWWAAEAKVTPELLARARASTNPALRPTTNPYERIARIYGIQDLVTDVPNFTNAPDFDLNAQRPAPGQGGGGGGGGGGLFGGGGPAVRSPEAEARFDPRGFIAGQNEDSGPVSRINIKTWDPKTPYLEAMRAVKPEKAYTVYLARREKFGTSPAFYLDCADFLLRNKQRLLGIRVLTNVVELKLEDARLIRVAAHRLQQAEALDLAIPLFERVLKLRPEEPQSLRDLALALAARADAAVAATKDNPSAGIAADYGRALDLLNQIVLGNWDGRFPEVEVIVLLEANAISAKLQRLPNLGAIPNPIDPRLRQNLDCDLRIVMTWDMDQTDMDLWVVEPTGEVCMYNHNRTQIGGAISLDFTQGYGPEEYALRKALPGKYTIQTNFYGSRQQELTGACTVQATVITDFGRPTEKRQSLTLRLSETRETVTIGTVVREGAPPKK